MTPLETIVLKSSTADATADESLLRENVARADAAATAARVRP